MEVYSGIFIFYNSMETKICRGCQVNKVISDFTTDNRQKDKLRSKCKICEKNKMSIKPILIGENKTCIVCLEEKDLVFFFKRSDRHYKYEGRCKQCKKNGDKFDKKVFLGNQKRCSGCNQYVDLTLYSKCASKSGGVVSECKTCESERSRRYKSNLPLEIKKKRQQEDYQKNKDRYIKAAKTWVENNRERSKSTRREKEKYYKNTNRLLYIKRNVSSLIRMSFNRELVEGCKKSKKTINILGCTVEEFKLHIESQLLYWMNWDNYGNCKTNEYNCSWHLDHIIPVSLAKTEEELYLLNHWSNFQPLCSKINQTDKRGIVSECSNIILKIFINKDKNICVINN